MDGLEEMQARHRKEKKELQNRITSKKKNANKKTRRGVNDECARLEFDLKEQQEQEIASLIGEICTDEASDPEPESQAEPTAQPEAGTGNNTDGMAEKLQTTTISDDQPTTDGPKKKRNRQKERLARRAAEQEAAVIAAEEEAANMVDHKKIEKKYMVDQFKANSLVEQEIQPDGHCLFSAVADQLQQRGIPLTSDPEGTQSGVKPYTTVRNAAATYMETHPDDFAPFLEGPLGTYISKIRSTAEWGGQLELMALARTYNVEISVVQDVRTELIEPWGAEGTSRPERIWLAYYRHGYGLGEHYNSLRQIPN